jgi:hypothetical protein
VDLGSVRASRAGEGARAFADFSEGDFGEGAKTSTRGRVRFPDGMMRVDRGRLRPRKLEREF